MEKKTFIKISRFVLIFFSIIGMSSISFSQDLNFQINPTYISFGKVIPVDEEGNLRQVIKKMEIEGKIKSNHKWVLKAYLLDNFRDVQNPSSTLPSQRMSIKVSDYSRKKGFIPLSLQSVVIAQGEPTSEEIQLNINLQIIIRPYDPPGRYTSDIIYLLDNGVSTSIEKRISVEVEVLPLMDVGITPQKLLIKVRTSPEEEYEDFLGEPIVIILSTNCDWELKVKGLEDLIDVSDENKKLSIEYLEYRVINCGKNWMPVSDKWRSFSKKEVVVARGGSTFEEPDQRAIIKILYRLKRSWEQASGEYSVGIAYSISTLENK
ncbi:hypothetical protein J7K28_06945 [Candidatus Aerophobetes bacterium]|nr:hypothetical protein [Candidatus Aerophobetes bacterium]